MAPNWPSQGEIKMENLCIKYREELDLALIDLTLKI